MTSETMNHATEEACLLLDNDEPSHLDLVHLCKPLAPFIQFRQFARQHLRTILRQPGMSWVPDEPQSAIDWEKVHDQFIETAEDIARHEAKSK